MMRSMSFAFLTLLLVSVGPRAVAQIQWVDTGPPPGVYLHWYEPSFYAGFAPRSQDPSRIHVELGRGNQLRVTIVVGPEQIEAYPEELLHRRDVIRSLIEQGVIVLSQNSFFDAFELALDEHEVEVLAAQRSRLGADPYRERCLELLEALNPGRVFRIAIPMDQVVTSWAPALREMDDAADEAMRLRIANAALPGRLHLTTLDEAQSELLDQLRDAAAREGGARFRVLTESWIERASGGRYRVEGGEVRAVEMTSVYPAGTVSHTTSYKGRAIPDFGRTGVWPLIPRKHGKGTLGMVDYISTNPAYGFLPNMGYEYAGGIAYNSYHNAAARAPLTGTPFLPAAWRKAPATRDGKRPFQNLWLVSRGPVSHGCTRLGSGHLAELRVTLPSDSEVMTRVRTFRNLPQCYDVFDVDGDGSDEVMGVSYFLAYKANENRTPVKAHAPNDRQGFYEWLYGDDLVAYGERVELRNVITCDFIGRRALEGGVHERLPLWEAPLPPEPLQFYRPLEFPFDSAAGFELAREVLRIGLGYEHDRGKLRLRGDPELSERPIE